MDGSLPSRDHCVFTSPRSLACQDCCTRYARLRRWRLEQNRWRYCSCAPRRLHLLRKGAGRGGEACVQHKACASPFEAVSSLYCRAPRTPFVLYVTFVSSTTAFLRAPHDGIRMPCSRYTRPSLLQTPRSWVSSLATTAMNPIPF